MQLNTKINKMSIIIKKLLKTLESLSFLVKTVCAQLLNKIDKNCNIYIVSSSYSKKILRNLVRF